MNEQRSGCEVSVSQTVAGNGIADDAPARHLLEWDETFLAFPEDKCIHQLFEIQALKTPDAVALVCDVSQSAQLHLSYAEVNVRANQLAHYLLTRNVGPETRVGICLRRSADMVVGILAVLKAGGCYVPLDPEYPESRLAYIVEDSGVDLALTQEQTSELLDVAAVNIDCDWQQVFASFPGLNTASAVQPSNLAYVIYTSGSTGRPKGVAIEHRSAVSLLTWANHDFDRTDTLSVLASTSICFDLSIFEMFVPLSCGNECLIIDDVLAIDKTLLRYRISLINTVPSAIKALLLQQAIPDNVRVVNLAGERLKPELVDGLLSKGGIAQVNDLYGPTESTTYSTWTRRVEGGIETIGRPVANTTLYILDGGDPVAPGSAGELFIGGAGLARGYLRRPGLTASCFLPDPYGDIPGLRMYRTGDMGRYLPDGNIEYLGRVDQQVKIHGYRIELGEIENVLAQNAEVKDVVVTAHENERENTQLVAYVVPQERTVEQGIGLCSANLSDTDKVVDEWRQVYDDDLYSKTAIGDGEVEAINCFDGWLNSYNRLPIPLEEMQVWAELVVERLKRCQTRQILELGCGVGLLLNRLLPYCERYVGSDFSNNALNYLRANIPVERREQVELHCCEARDFSAYRGQSFDLIVLNSVLQCFPNHEYLLDTIGECIRHLNPGGVLFLGDVRNYDLLGAFSTSVELSKNAGLTDPGGLQMAVSAREAKDGELLLSPGFFQHLKVRFPEITNIEVIPKYDLSPNGFDNELFRYRYDALLHVGDEVDSSPTVEAVQDLGWPAQVRTEEEFRQLLARGSKSVSIHCVPDLRLQREMRVYRALKAGSKAPGSLSETDLSPGIDESSGALPIVTYIRIASECGYEAEASLLHEQPGHYTLHLWLPGQERPKERLVGPVDDVAFEKYASDPMRLRRETGLKHRLRDYLRESLPDFMNPSAFIVLPELPLNANGKIDRTQLPSPDSTSFIHEVYVPPRNEREKSLAEIWEKTLSVSPIGILDNFFSLGGDSILSIQLIAQARQRGYGLTTKQILENPTIESLAMHLSRCAKDIPCESSAGELRLLPMQHLICQSPALHQSHWQSMLLSLPDQVDAVFVQQFLNALYRCHDVFRLEFFQTGTLWRARYRPIDDVPFGESLVEHSLDLVSDGAAGVVIAEIAHAQITAIGMESGLLFKAVFFTNACNAPDRLLLLAHNLVMDDASWRILFGNYCDAVSQWQAEKAVVLQRKGYSLQAWSRKLHEFSRSCSFRDDKKYWVDDAKYPIPALPLDLDDCQHESSESPSRVSVSLNKQLTGLLREQCAGAYGTTTAELLICSTYLAVQEWTGQQSLRLSLKGSARQQSGSSIAGNIEFDHTIGCFDTVWPLNLKPPANGDESGGEPDIGGLIKSVKESIRTVPHQGIGYGVLKYLHDDPVSAGKSGEILFAFNEESAQDGSEQHCLFIDEHNPLPGPARTLSSDHKLGIVGNIEQGLLRLDVDFRSREYQRHTVKMFADLLLQSLVNIIYHCGNQHRRQFTPSDFPLAGLNQADVDALQARFPELENCYAATELQSGLIFHSRFRQEEYSEGYIVQVYLEIEQALDVERFKSIWQHIATRYDAFRSVFDGLDRDDILQLVFDEIELPWTELDWRRQSDQAQATSFQEYCNEDRKRPFDLFTAPLMRFTLIRESTERFRFVWTYHHSILDGWSMAVVLREMSRCYSCGDASFDAVLPAPAAYTDYLHWLNTQDREVARKYWLNAISAVESKTDLGLKCERETAAPGAETRRNQVILHRMSREKSRQIENFARQNQVTLNILILAGWALVLSRYSGNSSVLTGQTISGRDGTITNVEQMVGLLIHTLPVRVDVAGQSTIQQWLKKLHRQSVEREKFGYLSLIEIQKCSSVPLTEKMFDTLVAFVNYPMDNAELEYDRRAEARSSQAIWQGSEYGTLPVSMIGSNESTNYDLTLVVIPSAQLTFKLNYRAADFSGAVVERLMSHMFNVLEGIVSGVCRRVAELPMLSATEREQLLFGSNRYAVRVPDQRCVHELFETMTERTPDAIAVVSGNTTMQVEQLSFSELNRSANRVARYLVAHGVRLETRVVVYQEQGIDRLVSILAIMKSGAACVPIDSSYAKNRVNLIIGDSEAAFVLTRKSVAADVDNRQCTVVSVDSLAFRNSVTACADTNLDEIRDTVRPQNLAYVIYTSGSTGRPKGVMQTHQTLVNLVQAQRGEAFLNAAQITLQLVSISFDVAMQELATSWYHGSKLVLVPVEYRHDCALLWALIVRQRVERIFISPVLAYQLFQQQRKCSSVREIICAGERLRLTAGLVAYLQSEDSRLLNHYGPTETHVATAFNLHKGDVAYCSPIGRALDNFAVYVLSRTMSPVPVGVCGELFIGGVGLARGYLNRAMTTAEKFVPHPYAINPGERLYRTGDLVRCLPDADGGPGELEFIGRTDHQVKIRGHRIEPGEIETVLLQYAGVKSAVVIALDTDEYQRYLVAYVLRHETEPAGTAQADVPARLLAGSLRHFCAEQLPGYMVPADIVVLDEFPLTANGKINRRALPVPERRGQIKDSEAPKGETETMVAALWTKVLKREQVSRNDDFFELGGHSILLMQLVEQIHRKFQVHLGVTDVFKRSTVSKLAGLIDQINRLKKVDNLDDLSEDEAALFLAQMEA